MTKIIWTQEILDFIKNNHHRLNYIQIGKKLNICRIAIGKKAKELGLFKKYRKSPSYETDRNYFCNWSSNMSYILGYIMADGCINKNTLVLNCKNDDIELLEFIKSQISPNRPIKYLSRLNKSNQKIYNSVRLELTDKFLIESLYNLNIISRKTGKEKLPNIPIEFVKDYIRGLFDGDGCITGSVQSEESYSRQSCSIASANKQFLLEIQKILNIGYITSLQNGCYTWKTANKSDVNTFMNFIYYPGCFYLKRKYNKFLELGFKIG